MPVPRPLLGDDKASFRQPQNLSASVSDHSNGDPSGRIIQLLEEVRGQLTAYGKQIEEQGKQIEEQGKQLTGKVDNMQQRLNSLTKERRLIGMLAEHAARMVAAASLGPEYTQWVLVNTLMDLAAMLHRSSSDGKDVKAVEELATAAAWKLVQDRIPQRLAAHLHLKYKVSRAELWHRWVPGLQPNRSMAALKQAPCCHAHAWQGPWVSSAAMTIRHAQCAAALSNASCNQECQALLRPAVALALAS